MDSMSPDSSAMGAGPEPVTATPQAPDVAVYFDGTSSHRHLVTLSLCDRLEVREGEHVLTAWSYPDIRRADAPAGMLRLSCVTAPDLARLEIRATDLAAALTARCTQLDKNVLGGRSVATIVGWSLAATVSIVAMIWLVLPFAADRLAPLVPEPLERRIGDAAEGQIKLMFPGTPCADPSGLAAFDKLMAAIGEASGIKGPIRAEVLDTKVPNAFALPGGKVYLFSGLLKKAENPDEIAGVLAHELGHVSHRDNTRNLIYSGGTSFLIGLLFGDVTGSGALIFASRSMVSASYTREAEQNADDFSISVMHRLGRPTKPMGELIFRITGNQADSPLSFLANHPLTEDRLKHLSDEDRPASGPPLLTDKEWTALKAICRSDI